MYTLKHVHKIYSGYILWDSNETVLQQYYEFSIQAFYEQL